MELRINPDFQGLIPPLTAEEYEALKLDIATRGVQVAVECDEEGTILDGHHRVQACVELGVRDWPRVIRRGLTAEQKISHILALNLARRQLTRAQRAELEAALRQRGWSYRRIASAMGVAPITVHRDLQDVAFTEFSGVTNVTPDRIEGADGKSYAAQRPLGPSQPEDRGTVGPSQVPEVIVPPDPQAALRSSQSNEWFTPKMYVEAAREVMGDLDLDPASSFEANQTIRARRFFTKDDDGLLQEWPGRVWLNPPYGGLSGPFTAKLLEQWQANITTEAILLVNANATDTAWFQPLWDQVLCFTDHRINFTSPTGTGSGSTHGSVFAYFGRQQQQFAQVFSRFGAIVRRWPP